MQHSRGHFFWNIGILMPYCRMNSAGGGNHPTYLLMFLHLPITNIWTLLTRVSLCETHGLHGYFVNSFDKVRLRIPQSGRPDSLLSEPMGST
jgi:hypothetical protein